MVIFFFSIMLFNIIFILVYIIIELLWKGFVLDFILLLEDLIVIL